MISTNRGRRHARLLAITSFALLPALSTGALAAQGPTCADSRILDRITKLEQRLEQSRLDAKASASMLEKRIAIAQEQRGVEDLADLLLASGGLLAAVGAVAALEAPEVAPLVAAGTMEANVLGDAMAGAVAATGSALRAAATVVGAYTSYALHELPQEGQLSAGRQAETELQWALKDHLERARSLALPVVHGGDVERLLDLGESAIREYRGTRRQVAESASRGYHKIDRAGMRIELTGHKSIELPAFMASGPAERKLIDVSRLARAPENAPEPPRPARIEIPAITLDLSLGGTEKAELRLMIAEDTVNAELALKETALLHDALETLKDACSVRLAEALASERKATPRKNKPVGDGWIRGRDAAPAASGSGSGGAQRPTGENLNG